MDEYPYRDYDPIHPRGTDWRGMFRRALGPLVAVVVAAAKFGFILLKFASVFIAVGGYALIWGWKFAVGFVVLIGVHEMGHFLEAKREGLNPSWPVFVPFLGAYVKHTRGNPWQTARVAIAGPILGGIGSLVCYGIGHAIDSRLMVALAYFGFLLNLINLLPFGILDGGAVWRSARWLRLGGGGARATVIYALYVGTAAALVVGMIAAHVPQHRL